MVLLNLQKKKELSMKRSKKNGRVGTSSKLTRLSSGKSKHDKENTLSERNVKGMYNYTYHYLLFFT